MSKKLIHILFIIFVIVLYHLYNPVFFSILAEWSGQDFQWQPSKCVFEGINHYSSYLNEDGICPKFKSQNGDYAHGIYILLYPFTLFEWQTAKILWSLSNLFLVIFITYLICKKFALKKLETLIIIFFILYSKVTPNNIALGQQTIFILFFLFLPFILRSKFFYILSGISYLKYNIGYALFLLFIIKKDFKNLLYSLLIPILGILFYCFLTSTNLLTSFFQPIEVMLKSTTVFNNIFLFSFINELLFFDNSSKLFITLIFSLLTNFYLIYKISKIDDNLLKMSCISLVILITTPHHGHDFILLIPLLIHSIKYYEFNSLLTKFNLLVSIYFLHFYYVIPLILEYFKVFSIISDYFETFILLIALILNLIFYDRKIKNPQKFLSEGF
jgi:hypothetical protein